MDCSYPIFWFLTTWPAPLTDRNTFSSYFLQILYFLINQRRDYFIILGNINWEKQKDIMNL